ncbi:hypothetical protein GBAR_LOCUS17567 [Geodia barretti]|nr:hypothetical protein GBAR_LOCUS17567 [Geodia barretti]
MFLDFLDLCHEHNCLSKLVNIPMTESEDAMFCGYLEECPSFQAQELLVMHYAAHSRYGDAIIQQSKIRPLAKVDPVPGAKERSLFRDGLLEAYRAVAPRVLSQVWRSGEGEPVPLSPSRPPAVPRTRVKNPPLSSVLAKKEAATKIVSSADVIFKEMQRIKDAAEAEPASSPFTQKDSVCPSTPFFSHPPSVRKAMLSRQKSLSTMSVVQATPVAVRAEFSLVSTPFQPSHSSSMVSGLTSLRTHMEGFKQRMLQMSQTANIDPSLLATPTVPLQSAQQPGSVYASGRPLPASILKVKNGRREKGEAGQDREGGRGEPRRIRFAEEGTVMESPAPSLTTTSVQQTHSLPPESKPGLTSAQAMAAATPLPSGEDSDLFYSFTDSPTTSAPPPPPNPTVSPSPLPPPPPSHFSQSPLLQGTPSQSPLPKTQLFIGADDEDDEDDKQQQQQQQSMDATSVAGPQSSGVTATTSSPQQKIRFPVLSRESIGFRPRATPTSRVTGGTFTPRHPSPLAHAITSREPKLNFPGGPQRPSQFSGGSDRGRGRGIPSPSLGALSATMVPVLTEEEGEEREDESEGSSFTRVTPVPSKSSTPDGDRKYIFSRGKIISTPPPLPPPVSELRDVTPRGKESGYVFSPPFTRSAARRAAAGGEVRGRMGRREGETTMTAVVVGEEEEQQKGKKLTSTRRRSLAGVHIELVTPPSQNTTPITGGRKGQRSKKKVYAMSTRSSRSTRLVQDKKPS